MYVLAEGWNGGELTDEVEVGGSKGMNSTAVVNRQSLICGQSQVLHKTQRTFSHTMSEENRGIYTYSTYLNHFQTISYHTVPMTVLLKNTADK